MMYLSSAMPSNYSRRYTTYRTIVSNVSLLLHNSAMRELDSLVGPRTIPRHMGAVLVDYKASTLLTWKACVRNIGFDACKWRHGGLCITWAISLVAPNVI